MHIEWLMALFYLDAAVRAIGEAITERVEGVAAQELSSEHLESLDSGVLHSATTTGSLCQVQSHVEVALLSHEQKPQTII